MLYNIIDKIEISNQTSKFKIKTCDFFFFSIQLDINKSNIKSEIKIIILFIIHAYSKQTNKIII